MRGWKIEKTCYTSFIQPLHYLKKPLNYTTPYLHYQKLIEAYFKPLTQMEYLALVSFQTPFNSLKIESG